MKVKFALSASVPFVAKAGGHSSWSTISNGFILDFSLMRGVVIDKENQTATASAGTLIGDMMKAAAAQGLCVGRITSDTCSLPGLSLSVLTS